MHCILIFFIRRAVYNAAMKNIVVLDEMTMRGGMLRPSFPHRWTAHPQTSPGQVAERIQSAHIVITNKVPVAAADIRRAKDLQLVAVAATGVDNIALPACRAAGIAVCNVRDYASRSVAEHVVALLFALARGVVRHHQKTVAGEWSASPVFSPDMGSIQNVERMRLGVLGAGALGRATARLAKQIGMRPVFWRRTKNDADVKIGRTVFPRLPLSELLESSDAVSLHCPLTADSRHLINRAALAKMKPGAFLINTARGGLVDSAALAQSLRKNHLGGAAVDVLPSEPPPPNDPLLTLSHPNLIITPHIAWASRESLAVFHRQLRDNLEKFHAGRPQNLI